MRRLLKKWRAGWGESPAKASGLGGPISLCLQGSLVRSASAGTSRRGEADERPWEFEVVIARPGYSLDGKWFLAPGVLREAASLFEGAQAFANHAPQKGPTSRISSAGTRMFA